MILVAAAVGLLVLLIIAFKIFRMVASGCLRLIMLAVLVLVAAGGWVYLTRFHGHWRF